MLAKSGLNPDSHINWAVFGFYLSVYGLHLIRSCQFETRSEIEMTQTQSFLSTNQIKTRSDIELVFIQSFCLITPDQNQMRYRTGSKSIVLFYYAGSKSDQKLNWLKYDFSVYNARSKPGLALNWLKLNLFVL